MKSNSEPSKKRELRGEDTSDSAIGSLHTVFTHENESSRDSGVSLGNSTKRLNPRAREFLSFNGQSEEVPGENCTVKFRRTLVDGLFPKQCEDYNGKLSLNSGVADHVSPYNPFPVISNQLQHCEMTTHSNAGFGEVPFSNVCASAFGPLFGFAPPTGPVLPPTFRPTSGFAPTLNLPHPSLGLESGFSATPRGSVDLSPLKSTLQSFVMNMNNPLPLAVNTQPSLRMQPLPCGTLGGLGSQHGPVPKPRIPDAKDQQAYEAWIEWRKATEPGYAMECKNRQQRRARRTVDITVPARVVSNV